MYNLTEFVLESQANAVSCRTAQSHAGREIKWEAFLNSRAWHNYSHHNFKKKIPLKWRGYGARRVCFTVPARFIVMIFGFLLQKHACFTFRLRENASLPFLLPSSLSCQKILDFWISLYGHKLGQEPSSQMTLTESNKIFTVKINFYNRKLNFRDLRPRNSGWRIQLDWPLISSVPYRSPFARMASDPFLLSCLSCSTTTYPIMGAWME